MNAIENMLQLDGFIAGITQMRQDFPREMMLAEGSMLGALGLGVLVFLLIGLFRGSARALSSAAFIGVTCLMVAFLFGRLGFLPDGSVLILQALMIGAAILFLTVTIKVARDNILIGLIMLLGLVAAICLGAAGFVGAYPAEVPMQMLTAGTAFCAVVMVLFLALGGDRRAVLLSLPVLLCAGSLLAMLIGARAGVSHWLVAVLPFGMLTTGALFAGLMALIPVPGAAAARRVETPSFSEEAIVAFGEEEPDELPESLTSFDDEPARPENDYVPDAEPKDLAPVEEPPVKKAQSPISSLWGAGNKAAAPVTAAGALWDWSASGEIAASEQTPSLFGVETSEALTPETVRGLLDHESLEAFDDAILGGENPATGPLDLLLTLGNGQRLQVTGTRHVDDDALVSRIEARVSKFREEEPRSEPVLATPEIPQPGFSAEQIQAAIAAGEIRAWFQPIVKVDSEEIAGFEALARWHRPGEDPLTAEDFISSVIEAGLETDVTALIAEEAAKELAEWIQAEPGRGQFVSFNISAASLIDAALVKIVQKVIKDHKLPAGALVVELTESHVVENQAKALQVAKALRQAGARLALDDLGAGYSSLNQLTKFKFDIVKTDRSLIAAIVEDDHARTLLGGVIGLAGKLGMQVVAEGTESAAAAEMLREMGCDYAQGYHFGAPEPAEGVETLSEDEPARPVAMAELR